MSLAKIRKKNKQRVLRNVNYKHSQLSLCEYQLTNCFFFSEFQYGITMTVCPLINDVTEIKIKLHQKVTN